jgi:hypothetical protein
VLPMRTASSCCGDNTARLPPAVCRGEYTSAGHADRFRLLLWDNQVFITSGGLRRDGTLTGLDFHMISQIQDAARRWVAAMWQLRGEHLPRQSCVGGRRYTVRGWRGCLTSALCLS